MDCSGLVSCGACRGVQVAERSGRWRHTTATLEDVTTAVADPWKDNILPGDVINMPQHHVMSYKSWYGPLGGRVFLVIEAYGTENYEPAQHCVAEDQD